MRAAGASAPHHPAAPEPSAPTWASLPLLLHPKGFGLEAAPAHGGTHGRGVVPLSHRRGGGSAVCRRTTTCTKPAGHQGFCSGHKGFKRRESPTASSALGRRPFGRCVGCVEWQQAGGLGAPPCCTAAACACTVGCRQPRGSSAPAAYTPLPRANLPSAPLAPLPAGSASGRTMMRTSSPATTTPHPPTPRP